MLSVVLKISLSAQDCATLRRQSPKVRIVNWPDRKTLA